MTLHSSLTSPSDLSPFLTHNHSHRNADTLTCMLLLTHVFSYISILRTHSYYVSQCRLGYAPIANFPPHPHHMAGEVSLTHTLSHSLPHIPSCLTHTDTQSLYQSAWAGLCCSNKHSQTSALHSIRACFLLTFCLYRGWARAPLYPPIGLTTQGLSSCDQSRGKEDREPCTCS